jgi:UDP-N-acetylglucosamine 4,6-dehydratase/5-epimerase
MGVEHGQAPPGPDLVVRRALRLSKPGQHLILTGKSVLCTGATGSFGNAFVRRALEDGASRVCVFSRGEAKQAQMAAELRDPRMRFFIGDVRDAQRVYEACKGVDYVVHAAALKRVETCEADPNEAVATNIVGTQNVARACIERGVERAVLLSTDKAASPHTLYGFTKATAERVWVRSNVYAAGTPTRFSATRYGNVLGSTGSVVPVWRAQHAAGQAITVTEASMTRFWMRIADAVDLVTLALSEMRGGEVFVPKIGSSTVETLADAVVPGATVTTCGLRPGEKLHEMLISEDESRHTLDCGSHYVIRPEAPTWGGQTANVIDGSSEFDNTPWTYRSDSNPKQLSADELRDMVA